MKASKVVLLGIGLIIIFGVSLAVSYFAFGQGAKPGESSATSPTSELVSSPETTIPAQERASQPASASSLLALPASAQEMFPEFICPCCGQPIGECDCGMAKERKGFVTGLVSAGKNRLEIYLAYADEYGLDTFASDEVRDAVREYKLAHAPAERPQIVLEPQKVDLGDVSVKGGKVETSISIKNSGQKDLVVKGLSTSCGCTTVSVVNNGQEGPVFGAGTSAEGWSTTIPPGGTAELKVYYDPTFHEGARGRMMREIYVSSNDPVDPVVKASIELNQVD